MIGRNSLSGTLFSVAVPLLIGLILAAGATASPPPGWSTFLGGNSDEKGCGIATDSVGNVYVVGTTYSTNFPALNGWDSTPNGGISQAFVAKFTPAGTLRWSTYLGGSVMDQGRAIAVDGPGNVFVTGVTWSSDFPTQNGADTTFGAGVPNAFVTKFDTDGALIWSTFLGSDDEGNGIALDDSGNIYVAGFANSNDFPTPGGPYTTCKNGDACVAKLDTSGAPLWGTFLGGSSHDEASAVAVDGSGNICVTGYTESSNFPTPNGRDTHYHSSQSTNGEAFVTKFNTGGAIAWSTYHAGSTFDWGLGITADSDGNVYVTGFTYSSNFPTANAAQATYGDLGDGFVSKFDTSGSLLWSTFLGGAGLDQGNGIALDSSGNVYVTGATESAGFPSSNGWDMTYNGHGDAFAAKFSNSGTLTSSTFLGGSAHDEGVAIAAPDGGHVFLTGYTKSGDLPTENAWDAAYDGHGCADSFVMKLDSAGSPTLIARSTPITGIALNGTQPGRTDYARILKANTAVTLKAPSSAPGGYVLVQWSLNGKKQACGNPTLKLTMAKDALATVCYKAFKSLKVTGPATVKAGAKATYICRLYCKDKSYCAVSPYAKWTSSSRYAKFRTPGKLTTYPVPSNQRVKLTAKYAGKSAYLYITIKK